MKMHYKNIIRGWLSTLVALVILTIASLKLYKMFETLTIAQMFIIVSFYILGISLIFVKDSFLKDMRNKFLKK